MRSLFGFLNSSDIRYEMNFEIYRKLPTGREPRKEIYYISISTLRSIRSIRMM